MVSSKRNKTLYIDKEAISALSLVKAGLLSPVTGLHDSAQAEKITRTGQIHGKTFPFPFLLAPNGKRNRQVLRSLEVGEEVDLITKNSQIVGTLVVDEVFEIDINQRLRQIYGTDDPYHPGVASTSKRLGNLAVAGEYQIDTSSLNLAKRTIHDAKRAINARSVTAIMMAANPFHRAHERILRHALDKSELVVIFLLKPYQNNDLSYELRHEVLSYFIEHFLPKDRVIIITLENSYIFGGFNEVIIDAIVAQNYGCDHLMIGQNHAGVGVYYDHNEHHSIKDRLEGIDIDVDVTGEYVFCDQCTTLVSTNTCPHGHHHHISYHADSILELLKMGILPPTVLMRRELSSIILANLFPYRFKNLEKIYHAMMPSHGLIEEHDEIDFYSELMKLYQTNAFQ